MRIPLLDIQNLSVAFNNASSLRAVKDVSFHIQVGEVVALIGMSGSGKTLTALSILQLIQGKGPAQISGQFLYHGRSRKTIKLHELSSDKLKKLRGGEIGLIFQNGQQALNPSISCGKQVEEAILAHKPVSKAEAKAAVLQLFNELGLSSKYYHLYPHQLSGGQQQRILIAIAVCCAPALIIADEPTASLDKQTQKEVMELLLTQCKQKYAALLLISHDIRLVSDVADRVLVMHQGEIIEENVVENILFAPQQEYTKQLVECFHQLERSQMDNDQAGKLDSATYTSDVSQPLLKVENLHVSFRVRSSWFRPQKQVPVLKGVNLEIRAGETIGLLGNSGGGKSTLARTLMALHKPDAGIILLDGEDFISRSVEARKSMYRKIQLVFQDANSSLNPRMTVEESIQEPMRYHAIGADREQRRLMIKEMFSAVDLDTSLLTAYPHELSGGQRQRIVIARALVLQPKLLILDEPIASLDAPIQLQVLSLLKQLKRRFGLSYLFISHDINVLRFMSDQILEIKEGQIVPFKQPRQVLTPTNKIDWPV